MDTISSWRAGVPRQRLPVGLDRDRAHRAVTCPESKAQHHARRIDPIGQLLVIAGARERSTYGIIDAPSRRLAHRSRTLILFGVALAVAFVSLVAVRAAGRREPLIEIRFFQLGRRSAGASGQSRSRVFAAQSAASCFINTLYLQDDARGLSPLDAGPLHVADGAARCWSCVTGHQAGSSALTRHPAAACGIGSVALIVVGGLMLTTGDERPAQIPAAVRRLSRCSASVLGMINPPITNTAVSRECPPSHGGRRRRGRVDQPSGRSHAWGRGARRARRRRHDQAARSTPSFAHGHAYVAWWVVVGIGWRAAGRRVRDHHHNRMGIGDRDEAPPSVCASATDRLIAEGQPDRAASPRRLRSDPGDTVRPTMELVTPQTTIERVASPTTARATSGSCSPSPTTRTLVATSHGRSRTGGLTGIRSEWTAPVDRLGRRSSVAEDILERYPELEATPTRCSPGCTPCVKRRWIGNVARRSGMTDCGWLGAAHDRRSAARGLSESDLVVSRRATTRGWILR